MFRTKEKLTAILVAIVTFAATLLLGFATLLGMPQKVSTAKATTTSQYVKVTEAPTDWSGTYLIVCETDKVAFNGGLTTLDAVSNTISVTISDNKIEATDTTNAAAFTIDANGYIKSASGYYIGQTSNANGLKSSISTTYTNTLSLNSDYSVNIVSGGAYLRYNATSGQYRFRYYKSSSYTGQKAICLYKFIESGSSEPECTHENKVLQPVTGTKTHIYFCNDCQKTVGEAANCIWGEGKETKEPTSTETGVMTYTCTECPNTKEEIIPKLDAVIYTITYSTPNGITVPDAEEIAEGFTATLPTATAPDGYVFVGWTTNKDATSEEDVLTAGTEYKPVESVTLYALYKTDVQAGGWYLINSANSLEIGAKYTIVASGYNYVIGTSAGNYFNRVEITKDTANETFSCSTSFNEFTLAAGSSTGSYSFKASETTYLTAVSGEKQLKTAPTLNALSSWKITFSGVNAIIKECNSNSYQIMYNNSSPRFSCYTGTMQAVSLYKYAAGEEPTYSTNPCAHGTTEEKVTKKATCTEAGEKNIVCLNCGVVVSTVEISATGHGDTEFRNIENTNTHAEYCTTCDAKIDETTANCAGSATSNNDETTHTVTCDGCKHEFSEDCYWEGDTTLTCTACGATKETALCTITFSVLGSTDVIEAEQQYINKAIDLPTPDDLPMGASFVGWTTNENATTADSVLSGSYTVTADETLYALISYVRYESANAYKKVTEAPADWSGKYLIVYESGTKAYIFNGQDAVNGYVSATIQDGVIISNTDIEAVVATIESMTGGYSIKTANGFTYGTSGSNRLNFNKDTAQLNTIELTANNGILITSNTSVLRFNDASNQMRFRYYGSGQKAIQLYALTTVQVPTTTYTTTLTAKFNSASLTIGTDLTMNYYATVDAAYTDLKAQFTIAGDIIEVEGKLDEKGRYVFSLALPPQCMADNISAVLLSGETEIAWVSNYSVRTYAINNLNNNPSDELKALLYELLRYGEAAQQYTDYNTGNLATDGVTMPEAADVSGASNAYELTNHVENGTADDYPVYITAVGVRFENVNKIYVKFNATAENVFVRISRGGVVVTDKIALTDTILYTKEIYATAFDDVFTFEIFVGETHTQTLKYSVNSYVANRIAAGSSDTMTNLAKALYRYGEAAKAYATAIS